MSANAKAYQLTLNHIDHILDGIRTQVEGLRDIPPAEVDDYQLRKTDEMAERLHAILSEMNPNS